MKIFKYTDLHFSINCFKHKQQREVEKNNFRVLNISTKAKTKENSTTQYKIANIKFKSDSVGKKILKNKM